MTRNFRRNGLIFLSYRREDTSGHAGRLYDRLKKALPNRVFLDIDSIPPAVDFAEKIEEAVGRDEIRLDALGLALVLPALAAMS